MKYLLVCGKLVVGPIEIKSIVVNVWSKVDFQPMNYKTDTFIHELQLSDFFRLLLCRAHFS